MLAFFLFLSLKREGVGGICSYPISVFLCFCLLCSLSISLISVFIFIFLCFSDLGFCFFVFFPSFFFFFIPSLFISFVLLLICLDLAFSVERVVGFFFFFLVNTEMVGDLEKLSRI